MFLLWRSLFICIFLRPDLTLRAVGEPLESEVLSEKDDSLVIVLLHPHLVRLRERTFISQK